MHPGEMTRINVTWQLAGVILAIFVGLPCCVLIVAFAMTKERTPTPVYAVTGSLAAITLIWAAAGIYSQYRKLKMEDQLGSFVGRLALGSVMVIMCIISVTFALKNIGGNIVYGIGAAMGMYGVVLVGKAMTQTSDANN